MIMRWIAAALLLSSTCASAAELQPLPPVAATAYKLGAGDEVRINVFGLDALNNSYVVGDAGTLAVPLLPPVPAVGKSVEELQAQLVTMIRARELVREPSVSVQVQKYRPFFILGEVQRPGQYAYVPGMSVLTAVSIAGGYTFRANKKRATIVRPVGTESIRGRALPETQIQPGDTINVPEAWF